MGRERQAGFGGEGQGGGGGESALGELFFLGDEGGGFGGEVGDIVRRLHVPIEGRSLSRSVVASITFVRLLASVCPKVLSQC